jgi:hypothetical protein
MRTVGDSVVDLTILLNLVNPVSTPAFLDFVPVVLFVVNALLLYGRRCYISIRARTVLPGSRLASRRSILPRTSSELPPRKRKRLPLRSVISG